MKKIPLTLAALLLLQPLSLFSHEHHAPHHGSLQVMGEEFAHYELTLDPASGTLTVYVLDGEAEKPVRVKAKVLLFKLTPRGTKKPVRVVAKAVANELTGETVGDTSQFEATVTVLKGVTAVDGVLLLGEVKGRVFKNLKIKHPEGNEDGHDD
jgi:hypothetical protein